VVDEPKLVVRVKSGPACHDARVVAPGEWLSIGRDALCTWALPLHEDLDPHHATVGWDGSCASIQIYPGARPALVDGQLVARLAAQRATEIVLGQTVIQVVPESLARPSLNEVASRARDALVAGEPRVPLFAVLDAARSPRIRELLDRSGEEHDSLFEGDSARGLDDVAPYLVRLSEEAPLTEQLLSAGFGSSWGIFLRCSQSFEEVRRQLRRVLRVRLEDDVRTFFFRFYDPRSLHEVWDVLSDHQRAMLAGPIEAFLVERHSCLVELVAPELEATARYPLVLRADQWNALGEGQTRRFCRKLTNMLRTDRVSWLGQRLDRVEADEALRRVSEAVRRAHAVGLSTEAEVGQFVLLVAAWDRPTPLEQQLTQLGPDKDPSTQLHRCLEFCASNGMEFVDLRPPHLDPENAPPVAMESR
jgi:hypothetical protein